jgi:hypothetical protein
MYVYKPTRYLFLPVFFGRNSHALSGTAPTAGAGGPAARTPRACSPRGAPQQSADYGALGGFGAALPEKIGGFPSSSLQMVPTSPNAPWVSEQHTIVRPRTAVPGTGDQAELLRHGGHRVAVGQEQHLHPPAPPRHAPLHRWGARGPLPERLSVTVARGGGTCGSPATTPAPGRAAAAADSCAAVAVPAGSRRPSRMRAGARPIRAPSATRSPAVSASWATDTHTPLRSWSAARSLPPRPLAVRSGLGRNALSARTSGRRPAGRTAARPGAPVSARGSRRRRPRRAAPACPRPSRQPAAPARPRPPPPARHIGLGRFVLPLMHFIPDSITESVPLFLKR